MKSELRQMKVLIIPFERHPSQQSFLEEVFTHSQAPYDSIFLMRSRQIIEEATVTWGKARVFLFPEHSTNRLLRNLAKYFMDLRFALALFRLFRKEHPDVVLVRDLTFPLLVTLTLRKVFHFIAIYQRTFPYEYSWFDPDRVKNYRFPALWKVCRSIESALLNQLLHEADAILPISQFMKDDLVASELLDPDKIHPFGMGIDDRIIDSIRLTQHGTPTTKKAINLAYVGTLAGARRIDQLLKAIALVVKQSPTKRIHVDFIGGETNDIEQLRLTVAELGLHESVSFLGRLPRAQLYEKMATYDCGLVYIPNDPRYWVSCPTKLVECLSIGVPCVATDTARINLDLAEQTKAVVIAGADAQSFAEGILQFLQTPDTYSRAAIESRERIQTEYSYEAMRSRFAMICNHALRGMPPP